MKRRDRDTIINEKQVVKSKISNDRVLHYALNLGMITPENYDYLSTIGRSKQVGELLKEMSINNLDAITGPLREMLHKGLIAIVENKPTPAVKPTRPAEMPAESEKEAEEADEEAHHIEDDEKDEGDDGDGDDTS